MKRLLLLWALTPLSALAAGFTPGQLAALESEYVKAGDTLQGGQLATGSVTDDKLAWRYLTAESDPVFSSWATSFNPVSASTLSGALSANALEQRLYTDTGLSALNTAFSAATNGANAALSAATNALWSRATNSFAVTPGAGYWLTITNPVWNSSTTQVVGWITNRMWVQ